MVLMAIQLASFYLAVAAELLDPKQRSNQALDMGEKMQPINGIKKIGARLRIGRLAAHQLFKSPDWSIHPRDHLHAC